MVGDTMKESEDLRFMDNQYKKVSFRIDTSIYNEIASEAER